MIKKILASLVFALVIIIFNANTMYAQVYYNPANGYYYPPNAAYIPVNNTYYDPNYSQNYSPYYGDPNYEKYKKDKVKKALTYSAIGAGAAYFLSDENKGRNALMGAGVGAALGYFLHK